MASTVERSFQSLSQRERRLQYRRFAQESLEKADKAPTKEIRAGYLIMASDWFTLATELERAPDAMLEDGAAGDFSDIEDLA